MAKNADLNGAKNAKKDEFYTQLVDIENEVKHYRRHFKGATVLCNCDDPECSNFYFYFRDNFEFLGLKKLISTCYRNQDWFQFSEGKDEKSVCCIYTGRAHPPERRILEQGGSFRSEECIAFLKEADIVCTNPPFSKFRDFMELLFKCQKKFLIIGNVSAITSKEIFPHFKRNELWLGASIHSGDREFMIPDDYPLDAASSRIDEKGRKFIRVKGVRWFTNLDYKERHEDIPLYRHYTPKDFPKIVNYDAIFISKTEEIPCDYDGEMGVPITFMDRYNPAQFEIVGSSLELADMNVIRRLQRKAGGGPRFYIEENGELKRKFERIVIRRRKDAEWPAAPNAEETEDGRRGDESVFLIHRLRASASPFPPRSATATTAQRQESQADKGKTK